jgi:hypothetical protein
MFVSELIKKLQEYPQIDPVSLRQIGDNKIIMVVVGHEFDPVFQCYLPLPSGFTDSDESRPNAPRDVGDTP